MDPTQTEIETFATLANVVTWAGLAGDPADVGSVSGSFLDTMGLGAAGHIRTCAAIPEADFAVVLATWRIPTGAGDATIPPTAGQLAQAGLVGRGARVALGVQKTVAQTQAEGSQEST